MDGSAKRTTEEFTARFLDLFGSFPGVVYRLKVVDNQFVPIWVSPNFTDVTGFEESAVVGNGDWWGSHLHPEDRDTAFENSARIFETGTVSQEYRFLLADGSCRWIHDELRTDPADGADGAVHLLGTWSDVTAIRQRQLEELRGVQQFQAIAETSPNIVTITRLSDGLITYANPAALAVAGYDPSDMIGRKAPDFYVNTRDREEFVKILTAEGRVVNFEVRLKKADGTPFWSLVNSQLVAFDDGPHVVAEITDVTDQIVLTRKIRENEERFRDFADTASDWYWEMDADLRYTFLSDNAFAILGMAPEFVIGKRRDELFEIQDTTGLSDADWQAHFQQLDNRKRFNDFRYWIEDSTGQRQHISISGKPVFGPDGGFRGYRGTGRLITPLTNAMESIRRAKEEAESASNAKSEFLSAVSHELRTPLNAILGFGQLLKTDEAPPLAPEHKEFVDHILNSGRLLLALINDILDLSKIESGNLALTIGAVELRKLVDQCAGLISPVADQRNIHIDLTGLVRHAPVVTADEIRLKQVILNLLSNAVKYNVEGGAVFVSSEDDADGFCRLVVRDTGIGIAEEDRPSLFEPFSRITTAAHPVEGSGLGLALTKKLVVLMGGRIGFESTVNRGSTFWVRLPRAETLADESQNPDQEVEKFAKVHGGRVRVLYVEDDVLNIHLMAGFLNRFGESRLHVAHSAELALEILTRVPVDVVLMDVHLPGMSGIKATARIRERPEWNNIPVIIVSANAMDREVQRGLNAGAVSYLTKPLGMDRFFETLNAALARRTVETGM